MRSILRLLLLAALLPALAHAQALPTLALRPGLVVTRSARIAPGVYRLRAPLRLDSALVTVRGEGITLDLTGVTLIGTPEALAPDRALGVAIRVRGGRDVTIRGGRIRGYRVGIRVTGTRGFRLFDADLSYNWRPRLYSLVAHESLADWLSYHHDEADEWLRFGAAVSLDDVQGGEIRGNTMTHGMNGLLMARTNRVRVWNNRIAFNSGLGIGMYRARGNTVMHNHADFNVRGYSHGFYRRGQDSAGLLMFEQCDSNTVAFNSFTHGGDGLFLWAGQTTMDTGEGGSNDNLFYANDFSFAPTNGMEATFSRNRFVGNRIAGSDHGLWGGYSFGSEVIGNHFARNRIGIAVEHGQANTVANNRFEGDTTAVQLWANPIEPSDWGYPKHRDTRSRDWQITGNTFSGHRLALRVTQTTGLVLDGNHFTNVGRVLSVDTSRVVLRGDTTDARVPEAQAPASPVPTLPDSIARTMPPPLPGGWAVEHAPALAREDRRAIVITEWGPYDFHSPLLWPAGRDGVRPEPLRVLGPPGTWRVVERRGIAAVSAERGRTGDTLVVTPAPGAEDDYAVTLEYRGAATVSPTGARTPAGQPVRFTYTRFAPAFGWTVRAFAWDDASDPRTQPEAFAALLRGTPLLTRTEPRLDWMWYRPAIPGLPQERWALEAEGMVTLPAPGPYTLRTISDDAVRVWVDDVLVIDDWTPHESAVDTVPILPGPHRVRVQHYQEDGWTELRVEIVRGVDRSTGSPGPH